MKYFLTGATGFIGGHIARQLRQADHEVAALVRRPDKAAALTALGVTLLPGDITDKESMRRGMAGVDGVFHVAAWYKLGVGDRSAAALINVEGTRQVLELTQELQVPKAVYTSTLAVFSDTRGKLVDESYRFTGKHLSEYDRTKWLAHYEVALPMIQQGLPLVIVLPGLVYGPGDHSRVRETFVRYLQRKLPLIPRSTAYCWSHVEDIARGHILAMERGKPRESYILAGPAHSLIEAFELAERITGIRAPRWRVSPVILQILARLMAIAGAVSPLPAEYHPENLRAIAGVTYLGDPSKAQRELGYAPRPLAEGLQETLRYEMERLGMRSLVEHG